MRVLFSIGLLSFFLKVLSGALLASSFGIEMELGKGLRAVLEVEIQDDISDSTRLEERTLDPGSQSYWAEFKLRVKNLKSGRTALLVKDAQVPIEGESLRKLGFEFDERGKMRNPRRVRTSQPLENFLEYKDYNFDGEKDLCVAVDMDHRLFRSWQCFFADPSRPERFDGEDTLGGNELRLDAQRKTLTVFMYDSGYLSSEEYHFHRGRGRCVRRDVYDAKSQSPFIVEESWRQSGKSKLSSKKVTLSGDGEELKAYEHLLFRIAGRDRQVLLIKGRGDLLYYASGKRGVNDAGGELVLDLVFPELEERERLKPTEFFELRRNAEQAVVAFKKAGVKYELFREVGGAAGVRMDRAGKVTVWNADPKTIEGDLDFSGDLPANVRLE
jgi:hypothetical protein